MNQNETTSGLETEPRHSLLISTQGKARGDYFTAVYDTTTHTITIVIVHCSYVYRAECASIDEGVADFIEVWSSADRKKLEWRCAQL